VGGDLNAVASLIQRDLNAAAGLLLQAAIGVIAVAAGGASDVLAADEAAKVVVLPRLGIAAAVGLADLATEVVVGVAGFPVCMRGVDGAVQRRQLLDQSTAAVVDVTRLFAERIADPNPVASFVVAERGELLIAGVVAVLLGLDQAIQVIVGVGRGQTNAVAFLDLSAQGVDAVGPAAVVGTALFDQVAARVIDAARCVAVSVDAGDQTTEAAPFASALRRQSRPCFRQCRSRDNSSSTPIFARKLYSTVRLGWETLIRRWVEPRVRWLELLHRPPERLLAEMAGTG